MYPYCDTIKENRKRMKYLSTLVEYHRKQWCWVADETIKQNRKVLPSEYIKQLSYRERSVIKEISEFKNDGMIACCYYRHEHALGYFNELDCNDYCPFVWDGYDNFRATCYHYDSSLNKWKNATKLEDCVKFARYISGLPVARNRVGVWCSFDF